MGRLPRRKLGRGVYHVYNRSAHDMWILDTDEHKARFMHLLKRYAQKYSVNIYHYCIMSNHFHLAIEGDITEISAFISGLCSRYSLFYHKHMQRGHGSIWQGRYKSILVQKENYLSRLGRYIELNPVRAEMISRNELHHYKWSSAYYYLNGKCDKLIKPLKHPYFVNCESFSESCKKRYAAYLNVQDEDDLSLFRAQAEAIGDNDFLSSTASVFGRIKLRAGRARKSKNAKENAIE